VHGRPRVIARGDTVPDHAVPVLKTTQRPFSSGLISDQYTPPPSSCTSPSLTLLEAVNSAVMGDLHEP
jgi:hypothetical protein